MAAAAPQPADSSGYGEGPSSLRIYVGAYSGVVTTLDYHPKSKSFSQVSATENGTLGAAPSWLTLDLTGNHLFSVDEVDDFNGANETGGVFSASVSKSGHITPISNTSTGAGPVSAELSKDGKSLAVASYSNGSLWQYNVDHVSRRLSARPSNVFIFQGTGPNLERQDHSYAHQVRYDPSGRLAYVCDLGADLLHVFRVEHNDSFAEVRPVKFPPGTGPRHMDFFVDHHRRLTYIYVISELANSVTMMTLEHDSWAPVIKQSVSTLPPSVSNTTSYGASEVVVSPDGRFVYAGNRQTDVTAPEDDNTFAIFERHPVDGTLKIKGFHPVGGKLPRHFALDHSGKYMVVGAQNSDRVVMHERDERTGSLTKVAEVAIESPAVQIFAPPHRGDGH